MSIKHLRFPAHPRLWCVLLLLAAVAGADAQTIRSTRYTGAAGAGTIYAARTAYDPSVALTVEAWVYRTDATRCETIVSQDYFQSIWFGFCGNHLRFYRSGRLLADATMNVEAYQWTHVAASYNGSAVSFFVDGQPAGVVALSNAGAGHNLPLYIGADPRGFAFSGNIDELRIWAEARTQSQIQSGMYQQLRSGNIVGAWSNGGSTEDLNGWTPTSSNGATLAIMGILPRDLIVPRSPLSLFCDGNIDPNSEYAGAEQLVVRYRNPSQPYASDGIVFLAHDDNNLFLGFVGLRWPSISNPRCSLYLDRDHSRSNTPSEQIYVPLDGSNPSFFLWNLVGAWERCTTSTCPPAGSWQVARGGCGDDVGPGCVEFRLSRTFMGDWDEVDGLMLFHTPGATYAAPPDGNGNENTFPNVYYSDSSVPLPRARVVAHVYDGVTGDRSRPRPNHNVYFGSTDVSPLYTQPTDANGRVEFDIAVPSNENLRLEVEHCTNCREFDPFVYAGNIQPYVITPHVLFYPMCSSGSPCMYAEVDFFTLSAPDATTITTITPPSGNPRFTLRSSGAPTEIAPTHVRINGVNLHDQINLFLSREVGSDPNDWQHFPVTITNRDPGWTWIEADIPGVPINGTYHWVITDNWVRPGWQEFVISAAYPITQPPYPLVWGFGFSNVDDDASLSEFYSVFGNNGYMCIGAFGVCLCRIPDPLYLLYYPIYRQWINGSNGSCMGYSGTSLMFKHGLLDASDFDGNAFYPRGLLSRQNPANYDWDLCGPPEPTDLWGRIRVNHGTQATAEAIDIGLLQLAQGGGVHTFDTSPNARLAAIRANPNGFAVSLSPGIGEGHVIVPWKVEDIDATHSRIFVYDNNRTYPVTSTGRQDFIDIDRNANTFSYTNVDGDVWSGQSMFTFPLSLYTGSHSAPGIEEALLWIGLFIFGDADGHYTSAADGTEWGWRQDGTFVENMPGAFAVNPVSGGAPGTRMIPLIIPDGMTVPDAEINVRGPNYIFQGARDGTVLQIEAFNGTAGDRDRVHLGFEEGRTGQVLRSMRFTPQRAGLNFQPRVGLNLGLQERAVFKVAGMQLPANGPAEFKALFARRGIEIKNMSNAATRYTLIAETVDGESETTGTAMFGPFDIPAGATHTAVINDWPQASQVRSELDLNGDGTPEEVDVVNGYRCGASPEEPMEDANLNGIPDLCELRRGDMNCDGAADNADIDAFVLALTAPQVYESTYPNCDIRAGDMNQDGSVDNADIDGFVQCLLGGGC